MRTAHAFTICRSLLLGGVYLPGPRGVYLVLGGCTCLVPGGCTCLVPVGCTCLVWGVYLVWGGVYLVPGGVPAWSQGGVPTWSGGCTWSQGVYLPGLGGVPAWSWGGVPAWSQGGCTCLVWGGYLPGLWGYLPGLPGGLPGQVLPPLWTEWHTLMKILPCPKLRLRAIKRQWSISSNK